MNMNGFSSKKFFGQTVILDCLIIIIGFLCNCFIFEQKNVALFIIRITFKSFIFLQS